MIDIQILASSSRGNCYLINNGITPLLLECGIPWKVTRQKLNFQTSSIAACLISHEHADHSKAWQDVAKAGINIYTSQGTINALNMEGHRIKPTKPLQQFEIGTWTILPFPIQHDAVEPFGFLLANQSGDKLLFATDTYYIKYKFSDLTHIMVECNHSADLLKANVEAGKVPLPMKNRLIQSHFSLENVKKFLQANDLSKVREIHLIHLSDGNSDKDRFKREIQALTGKMVSVAEK